MLNKLTVKNYAIIQDLEIDFDPGLIILTGETGSGKSILLGALGLILGHRADTKVVYDQNEKCIVEAEFNIKSYGLTSFFEEYELDHEDLTIIRREINPSGKTRAFINDTPVTLNILQELSGRLIDLHQQFDTLSISKERFQLDILDAIAGHQKLLKSYHTKYQEYQRDKIELQALKDKQANAIKEKEFLQFQYDELIQASLVADEESSLENEQNMLANAEDIKKQAGFCFNLLSDSEYAATSQLQEALTALAPLTKVHQAVQSLYDRLDSIQIELEDITSELEEVFEQTEYDPERLMEVEARLDIIYRLQKKHQVATVNELIDIQEKLGNSIEDFSNLDESIQDLEKKVNAQQKELENIAEKLHKGRKEAAPKIENDVHQLLAKVNMQNAQLQVECKKQSTLGPNGNDSIKFLFAANKGSRFQEIKDVASGGEMSRLALCIKSIIGDALALPTMIFDEIDTGVSGQVALQMSEILKKLSGGHQVVTITHTPQVAAKANQHFVVYKEDLPDRTYTRIKPLNEEERIHEIAVMLSTNPPSAAAINNAKELISI